MKASGTGWCAGRRLGASSIFAGESLHEYPTDAVDRAGMTAFRALTLLQPARRLILSVRLPVGEREAAGDEHGGAADPLGEAEEQAFEQRVLDLAEGGLAAGVLPLYPFEAVEDQEMWAAHGEAVPQQGQQRRPPRRGGRGAPTEIAIRLPQEEPAVGLLVEAPHEQAVGPWHSSRTDQFAEELRRHGGLAGA